MVFRKGVLVYSPPTLNVPDLIRKGVLSRWMGEGGMGLVGAGRARREGGRRQEERVAVLAGGPEMREAVMGFIVVGVTAGARGNLSQVSPALVPSWLP